MNNPTVKEALIEYMKQNGFTALCNSDIPCGCNLDDLIPCDSVNEEYCQLGYTKKCTPDECDAEECENKTDGVQSDCMTLTKPNSDAPAKPVEPAPEALTTGSTSTVQGCEHEWRKSNVIEGHVHCRKCDTYKRS